MDSRCAGLPPLEQEQCRRCHESGGTWVSAPGYGCTYPRGPGTSNIGAVGLGLGIGILVPLLAVLLLRDQ